MARVGRTSNLLFSCSRCYLNRGYPRVLGLICRRSSRTCLIQLWIEVVLVSGLGRGRDSPAPVRSSEWPHRLLSSPLPGVMAGAGSVSAAEWLSHPGAALSLSCQFGAWESEASSHYLCVSHRFSSCQVSLGDSSLEADHVISAVPASGNGVAPLPLPSQSEAKCSFLGQ